MNTIDPEKTVWLSEDELLQSNQWNDIIIEQYFAAESPSAVPSVVDIASRMLIPIIPRERQGMIVAQIQFGKTLSWKKMFAANVF